MINKGLPDIRIEDLVPHRGPMLLIDQILEVGENRAVTVSVVAESWPFWNGHGVLPLVLIELAAQTAGVCNGWDRILKKGLDSDKMGWLVGVKSASFRVDFIPGQSRIVTSSENTFKYDSFREATCVMQGDSEVYGEVVLQLFQA